MKINDLTRSCVSFDKMAGKHPSRTILATVSAGIVVGVLVRILYDREKHPTRIETAINAVHGIGDRVRPLFR